PVGPIGVGRVASAGDGHRGGLALSGDRRRCPRRRRPPCRRRRRTPALVHRPLARRPLLRAGRLRARRRRVGRAFRWARCRHAAEDRRPVTVELLHYRQDGSAFWVENSINPVTDEAGVCTHLVSIQRDVTERKLAEDALRKSEARFRLIVQHASDIITVLDVDGRVRYSSPAATRILGYAEGYRPPSVLDLVHPDDVDAVAAALGECMARPGVSDPVQFRMAHADGSWVPVEATANNLLGDADLGGVVVITRDIS